MEKAQVGDLIRAVVSCSIDDYNVGDILEVQQTGGTAVATNCGKMLCHNEYVIHRKAGEEDAPTVGKVMENIARIRDDVVQATKSDAVNPQHYKQGRVEVIDIIEDAVEGADPFEAVCQANVLKYALRYRHKNGVTDLRKMLWYGEKLIAYLDAKSTQD